MALFGLGGGLFVFEPLDGCVFVFSFTAQIAREVSLRNIDPNSHVTHGENKIYTHSFKLGMRDATQLQRSIAAESLQILTKLQFKPKVFN